MNKDYQPSFQEVAEKNERNGSLIADLKSLFKAGVLIANVLPVFTGFWLALYFSNTSFQSHLADFFLVMAGSTMVMAGALVINNWYDVDIDTVMERTKKRPTVTGHFSLKTVLLMGIVLTVLGFILLMFTTWEAVFFAFVGWFTYVFLYTMWSKRRFTANTIIGSISGAVSPLIGWTAIAPSYHKVSIAMFLILFVFQMPHTYAIAMRKCSEYAAAKVAMLPVVRGFAVTKRHMVFYIACLLPIPLLMTSLGNIFVILATIFNIGWLALSISGFFIKDDLKWARFNFLYSVNYIMWLFLLMVIVTLPIF